MTARLLPESESELSNAVEVLDPNSWPQEVAVEHGEVELRLLCDRFLVPSVKLSMNSETTRTAKEREN